MTKIAGGRFVWHDLMTTDPDAAQAFYTRVIGWGTLNHGEDDEAYSMWTVGDEPVGGVVRLSEAAVADGATPHWLGYISTPDPEATSARALALGGTLLAPSRAVPGGGTFAVLRDPQGAAFAILAPEGDDVTSNGPGHFSWFELATTDRTAALDFYIQLFGWERAGALDMGESGTYQMFGRGGTAMGGIYDRAAHEPAHAAWLSYAMIQDIEVTARRISGAGGEIVVGPKEVPGGDRIVIARDPQGAMFAIHAPAGESAG